MSGEARGQRLEVRGQRLGVFTIFLFAALAFTRSAQCAEAAAQEAVPAAVLAKEDSARALTLKEAINIAFINNKSVQIQEQELEFAKADITYSRSQFLPQVSVGYSYTLNDAIPSYGVSPPNWRKDMGVFTGYKNDNAVTLSANESIYNGGANIAALAQSKLNLKVQQETLKATRLDVEFETKRLFYGMLLAYETLRIAEDLVSQAKAHYDQTNTMFGQGTASRFDVLQSKTHVSTLIPQLVNAQNAVDLIMAELKKEIGVDMASFIKIKGDLNKYSLVEIKEEEFLKEAYKSNPQMILKLLGIDINKWAIELAKAGWLPQISATANYMYRSSNLDNMINPRHDLWNVGIKASIALFDGFATKAKVDEAKARYSQATLQKADLVDQLVVDIKSACINLKQAKAIIDSQRDGIVEADEALRLANVRFDNGVGINLDVLDAQVSLAQVQQALEQGIYDYRMAKAQLDRLMGRQYQVED